MHVTFQVLKAARMDMTVFWEVAPCRLVEVYRRFSGAYYRAITLIMEAVSTSETTENFYETVRRNNPEDGHLEAKIEFIIS
jgi:hypothetical protein